MAGEWATATIGEVTEKVAMGPFGSSIKVETFVDQGVPVISGQHLHGIRLDDGEYNFITEEHAERLKSANVHRGDVIFTHAGNIGQVAYIPFDSKYERYVISQRQFYLRCDQAKVLPEFIAYFFMTAEGRHKLLANTSSTGVPSIAQPVTYLRTIEIPLPPLAEQRAIAHILGTLDDKIELNRRMNDTLEAMARAIFKSWFVDGAEEGWEEQAVGDLADVVGGSTPSTKESAYWEDGIHHWVTPKDLSGLSMPVLLDTERRITDLGVDQIGSGILPVGTVLLSSRAPIGYLAITEIPVSINQGFIAMKPKADVSNLFLLLWARFAHDEIVSRANGSTFLEISKSNFRPIQVVVPDKAVMKAFDDTVRPLYARIVANERQSRTLATLRDALLPKLLTGEIRVRDAERFIAVPSA